MVGDDSLKQREHRNVLHAVGRTHHGQQEDAYRNAGPGRNQDDRKAPEDERDAERHRKPPSLQRERAEGPDQASDPDRRGQIADGARARSEKLENADDDQYVQAAANERLGRGQEDQQPGCRLGHDRPESAGKQLAWPRHSRGGDHVDTALDEYPSQLRGGHEQRGRGDEEDDADVCNRDQDPCDKLGRQAETAGDRRGIGGRTLPGFTVGRTINLAGLGIVIFGRV